MTLTEGSHPFADRCWFDGSITSIFAFGTVSEVPMNIAMNRLSKYVARLILMLLACMAPISLAQTRPTNRAAVENIVKEIQKADYEGDRASLAKLYKEL